MRVLSYAPFLFLLGSTQALLGTRCLEAFNGFATVPRRFLETIERDTCSYGCEPRPAEWKAAFEGVFKHLIQDGARHTGIDDPEAQAVLADSLDSLFQDVAKRCASHLGDGHLCSDTLERETLKKCVDENARSAAFRAAAGLMRHITEDRCEKVWGYLNSDQLWDKDMPARGKVYVNSCKEL